MKRPKNLSDWRRRHALQLASQLPDDLDDALAVVDLTRELLLEFLQRPHAQPAAQSAPVVSMVRP